MMIDPSIIEGRIEAARQRDDDVTAKLLSEIARLPVCKDLSTGMLYPQPDAPVIQYGNRAGSGMPEGAIRPLPDNGSFAYQLYSAICFVVDARTELKLLELIASPDFYSALMRSAAEVKP